MATSQKKLDEKLRDKTIKDLLALFTEKDEDVMQTKAGTIAFPCVDEENNDRWITITVQVPTGSRDGTAYDGYSEAEDYQMHLTAKAEKAEETAKKKAVKIAKDKAMREQLAKQKAEREAKKADMGQ